jgi:predicted RecA/RadA family phage recombinase
MAKVYIEKERVDHVWIKNNTGAAIDQGDFVVIGSLSGVADRRALAAESLSIHIEPFLEIQVGQDDLIAAANANADGKTIYVNSATGKFADASGSGFVAVGQIAHNYISEKGYLTFFKYPTAIG